MPIPILFLAMFALGFGLLISSFAVYYADVAEMYQIVVTAWMYLSPVIYVPSVIPEAYRPLLALNPMYHLIQLFRTPLYYGQVPDLSQLLICGGIATFTLVAGWLVFTRKADEFAYRV
jgi:ABC-type polysaccharide/polyol phosphate export permease